MAPAQPHNRKWQWRCAPVAALVGTVLGCGCAGKPERAARSESPDRPTTAPALVPAVRPLSIGEVVAAPGSTASGADLLVHFHGAPSVVQREAAAAGVSAVVVAVNYKGMSSAYEKPFSDPALFESLLNEAWVAAGRDGPPAWRRVCLSSFSAGYGAVRALLRHPGHAARIDAIYLADSLYAGWLDPGEPGRADGGSPRTTTTSATRRLNPQNIEPFRRYAAEAAAGRRLMIVTHGYYDPVVYAGTHVTADDLIARSGAQRRGVNEPGPARLRVTSRVDVGGLHIFGCEGNTGEDHGEHLRGLRFGFTRLPISVRGGNGD